MDQQSFIKGAIAKLAEHDPSIAGGAYLRVLSHENLSPAQRQALHKQFMTVLAHRAKFTKSLADKGNEVFLGNSSNFIDDVQEGFTKAHPTSHTYNTGNSFERLQPAKGAANAQVVQSLDMTAFVNAMDQLLKQKQQEYGDRSFVSRLFHRKPTEKRLYQSSSYQDERASTLKKNPYKSNFYAHLAPGTTPATLKKVMRVRPDEGFFHK